LDIAYATGNIPAISGSAKGLGMSDATTAIAVDCFSANRNPALISRVDNQWGAVMAMGRPWQYAAPSKTGLDFGSGAHRKSQKNRIPVYPAGGFGASYKLTPEFSIGFSTTGGGGGVRFKRSVISPNLKHPKKLMSSFGVIKPAISWTPSEWQSYGIGLLFALQMLQTDLLTPSLKVTKGHNKTAVSPGIGFHLGGSWNLTPKISVGASFISELFFKKFGRGYQDVLAFQHASPNLPMIVTLGLGWHISPTTDFVLDIEESYWKKLKNTGDPVPVGGQKWRNTFGLRTGIQHTHNDWVFRTGYIYGQCAIPKSEVAANFFVSVSAQSVHLLTCGGTYKISKCWDFDFGGFYSFKQQIKDNGKGSFGMVAKGAKIVGSQAYFSVGFINRFRT
jgi:long-subunit fatty acid transport protein